jgi:hypothetical protein
MNSDKMREIWHIIYLFGVGILKIPQLGLECLNFSGWIKPLKSSDGTI